jgi:hypothetical protein
VAPAPQEPDMDTGVEIGTCNRPEDKHGWSQHGRGEDHRFQERIL